MKKTVFFVLAVCLVLCSCGKSLVGKDISDRVYSKFAEMKSYRAEVKITTFSNKSQNTYEGVQNYKFPGKMRSESGDIVTVVNGQTAMITNPQGENPIKLPQIADEGKDFMFLHTFFDAYYNGMATDMRKTDEKGGQVTLCAKTGLDNPYKQYAELTLDEKTLTPLFFEIKYDGKVSVRIDYTNFELNNNPDDLLFEI